LLMPSSAARARRQRSASIPGRGRLRHTTRCFVRAMQLPRSVDRGDYRHAMVMMTHHVTSARNAAKPSGEGACRADAGVFAFFAPVLVGPGVDSRGGPGPTRLGVLLSLSLGLPADNVNCRRPWVSVGGSRAGSVDALCACSADTAQLACALSPWSAL
jgi:hypothetical protein